MTLKAYDVTDRVAGMPERALPPDLQARGALLLHAPDAPPPDVTPP